MNMVFGLILMMLNNLNKKSPINLLGILKSNLIKKIYCLWKLIKICYQGGIRTHTDLKYKLQQFVFTVCPPRSPIQHSFRYYAVCLPISTLDFLLQGFCFLINPQRCTTTRNWGNVVSTFKGLSHSDFSRCFKCWNYIFFVLNLNATMFSPIAFCTSAT